VRSSLRAVNRSAVVPHSLHPKPVHDSVENPKSRKWMAWGVGGNRARPSSCGKRSTLCGKRAGKRGRPLQQVVCGEAECPKKLRALADGLRRFGDLYHGNGPKSRISGTFFPTRERFLDFRFDSVRQTGLADVCHPIGNKFTRPNRYATPVHMPA